MTCHFYVVQLFLLGGGEIDHGVLGVRVRGCTFVPAAIHTSGSYAHNSPAITEPLDSWAVPHLRLVQQSQKQHWHPFNTLLWLIPGVDFISCPFIAMMLAFMLLELLF